MIGVSTTQMDLDYAQYPSITICQASVEQVNSENVTISPLNLNKPPNLAEILNEVSYVYGPR